MARTRVVAGKRGKTLCRAKDFDVDGNSKTLVARVINHEATVTL